MLVSSRTDKMFKKCIWVLRFTTSMVLAVGESPPVTVKDTSFPRLFNKQISGVLAPRTQWTYRPQADSHRHAFEGISHDSTLRATESTYEKQNESALSQEYWWSNPGWQNFTSANYYDYSKPSYGYISSPSGTGFFYKNTAEKIHSRYPYHQIRLPAAGSHVAIKKTPSSNLKEKLQVLNFDASGKHKFKKTTLYQFPSDYKKAVYSRVTKPYVKHKHPAQNYPLYRSHYYQSPYQRYQIPSSEMLRYKGISSSGGYNKASAASTNQNHGKRYTTERMDDAYSEGSATSEDYSAFNDTNHNTGGNYYEETYEEMEKANSDPEESSHEEGTTRGYYGDRIYMSTQVPLVNSDKTGVKNKYFIVRKTSHDDDIETLFE